MKKIKLIPNFKILLKALLFILCSTTEVTVAKAADNTSNIGVSVEELVSMHKQKYKEFDNTIFNIAQVGEGPQVRNETAKTCNLETNRAVENCFISYKTSTAAASAAIAAAEARQAASEAAKNAREAAGNGSIFSSPGIFNQATEANQAAQKASDLLNPAVGACEAIAQVCDQQCGSKIETAANYESDETQKEQIRSVMTKITKHCVSVNDQMKANVLTTKAQTQMFADSASKTANSIKKGALLAGAAVVGGIVYKNHQEKKKDKEKAENLRQEFEKGVITLANGEKLNCLDKDTFLQKDCREAMFNYCGKQANSDGAGCMAFSNNYCAEEDASQSYCLANVAKNYCKNSGNAVAQSPSCKWLRDRPSTCNRDAEDINCLPKISAESLATTCSNFAADPLCQKFANNGGSGTQNNTSAVDGSEETKSTMAALIAGDSAGSTTSASTRVTQLINLWSENSAALRAACARGDLVNCH